jgi:hypothetical protein
MRGCDSANHEGLTLFIHIPPVKLKSTLPYSMNAMDLAFQTCCINKEHGIN